MPSKAHQKAVKAINRDGLILVFPIDNKKSPHSIWYELHPRTAMRWEWDEDGDSKVADLWRLRAELSTSREVVYTKWFRNRATYFSKDLFTACLCLSLQNPRTLTHEAREILEALQMDSPLSTRQLKESVQLQGRLLESLFNKSMKQLWDSFQIVAFGEVEDSSFPSLAVGATQNIFEELWLAAKEMSPSTAQKLIDEKMPPGSPWRRYWDRLKI